ncbi:hypothetical protein O181_080644 [Austropuccinia psidii MF-1]|uniref:Integrase catalytic domain-containing protein n=1 Tax=Austropuccinia psidii MF-1 TaxID=1389203 RepID=A0A9Q3FKT7_9BASI|nr:hypothetical protein [Austropuccinia psidii MF-1]
MIQTLEDMIRRFCAYGLEFKHSYDFTHYWYTLIQALELVYKTFIHASTGKTPVMLAKGWNPNLSVDTLKKDLVDINPTAISFKFFLNKERHHEIQKMTDAFEYVQQKWDTSHKTPEFRVGELMLASTLSFNNIKGPKKLKSSLAGPFIIKSLHGKNALKLELTGELKIEHPTFLGSLLKHYASGDKKLFPLRNETPLEVPPLDQTEEKKVLKFFKARSLREKMKENT